MSVDLSYFLGTYGTKYFHFLIELNAKLEYRESGSAHLLPKLKEIHHFSPFSKSTEVTHSYTVEEIKLNRIFKFLGLLTV